jgi:hypothetical protein
MKIGSIMEDAFKYPFSNWKRFLILGLIFLAYKLITEFSEGFGNPEYRISLLIAYAVINLVIEGYLFRSMGNSIKGDNELPKFDQWPRMFTDGMKVFLILFIYGFIPGIMLVIGYVFVFKSALADIGAVILLMGIFLTVLFVLFMNMALANMAYHGKLSAALKIREICDKIKIIGWIHYIFLSIIITVIVVLGTIIANLMIDSIPILGFLGYFLISTYFELLMYRAFGLIYKETLDKGIDSKI